MWALRLFGLTLSIAALGWLIFLSYALYTRTNFGLIVLVEIGMPAALFSALASTVAAGGGLWLAGFDEVARYAAVSTAAAASKIASASRR